MAAAQYSLQRTLVSVPKLVVYAAGAIPIMILVWRGANGDLGAEPVKTLEHFLGLWALRFLVAGLAVTPLRRFGGPSLVKYRRALGLLTFFYAFAHLTVYLILDRGLDAGAILADILKRPYITIGMFAFAILTPLAVTSNSVGIRRLGGKAWQSLHRWVYVAAIAAVVHYAMSVKSWPASPIIYAAIVGSLLLVRLALYAKKRTAASPSA